MRKIFQFPVYTNELMIDNPLRVKSDLYLVELPKCTKCLISGNVRGIFGNQKAFGLHLLPFFSVLASAFSY